MSVNSISNPNIYYISLSLLSEMKSAKGMTLSRMKFLLSQTGENTLRAPFSHRVGLDFVHHELIIFGIDIILNGFEHTNLNKDSVEIEILICLWTSL